MAGIFPAISLFVPVGYPSPAEVIRAYLHPNPVVDVHAYGVLRHLPARPGKHLEVVVQPDQEEPASPGLYDGTVYLDSLLLSHPEVLPVSSAGAAL